MKKKLIISGVVLVCAIGIGLGIFMLLKDKSTLEINNKADDEVVVKVSNASANSGGIGYLTLKDNQEMEITADLEKNGLKLEISSSKDGKKDELLKTQEFKEKESKTYSLAEGEYIINITAQKGATGTLKIEAK